MTREQCPRCQGTGKAPWIFNGKVIEMVRCSACQGKGTVAGKATPGKKRSKVQ